MDETTELLPQERTAISLYHNPDRIHPLACGAILLAQGLERLAWYSLSGNLLFYLTTEPLCWDDSLATSTVEALTGVIYVFGILGGILSDWKLSRYWTIILGYAVYILGYAYLPALGRTTRYASNATREIKEFGTSCNTTMVEQAWCLPRDGGERQCISTLIPALLVIGIGAGFVRTNLYPFGNLQVSEAGVKYTRRFASLQYWSLNIGSACALAGITTLQQTKGFFLGYLIPTIFLVFSFVIFLSGTFVYKQRPPNSGQNTIKLYFRMYREAIKRKKYLSISRFELDAPSLIDYCQHNYGGGYNKNLVNDVKSMWNVLGCLCLLLPYWICYSQTFQSVYLLQGLHLRLDGVREDYSMLNFCPKNVSVIKNHSYLMPAASLSVFNMAFIIICLPFAQWFYTWLAQRGYNVTILKRMLTGLVLLFLSLLSAALLEYYRLMNIAVCGLYRQSIDNTVYDAAPGVLIWWQIPQYAFLGLSEVFTVVTGIEYIYMEAPKAAHGLAIGLFWGVAGLGNLFGAILPAIFAHILNIWSYPYINSNRMDLFFYFLCGFLLVSIIILIVVGLKCRLGLRKAIKPPLKKCESVVSLGPDRQGLVNCSFSSSNE